MTTTDQLMTAEELWNLPDHGRRCELVRGELRELPLGGCEHGAIAANVGVSLGQWVHTHRLGSVLARTGFIVARQPDTVRGADIAFVSKERIPASGLPRNFFPAAPDLAVEVLSPGDTVGEVEDKINEYLTAGTRLVWVVNPRLRTVTVYRPGPQIAVLKEADSLSGEDVVPGFTCDVRDLFV